MIDTTTVTDDLRAGFSGAANFGRENASEISIRGGGHDVAGLGLLRTHAAPSERIAG